MKIMIIISDCTVYEQQFNATSWSDLEYWYWYSDSDSDSDNKWNY